MNFFEALVFGLVQGLTEYLPISSSAHLLLLPRFWKISDPGLTFDVMLHIGTLGSTLVYFRKEWLQLKRNEVLRIGLACFPAMLVGALFHQFIDTNLRVPAITAWMLIGGGILLWGVDRLQTQKRNYGDLQNRDALWVGLYQCLSLVPGFSRSGSTITAGRLLGVDRASAAKFSFMISAPITAAAIVFEMRHIDKLLMSANISFLVLGVGLLSSFIFGWLAIGFLIRFVSRFGYFGFMVYRIALGIAVLALL
jgi:undecaprenyl-diphosphatase